jgi:hypothetical protein
MSRKLSRESEQAFSRRLKRDYGFNYMQKRDDKGHKPYYWIGLKLKDWKPSEEGQSTLSISSNQEIKKLYLLDELTNKQ